jgi:hypothetical protein
MREGMRVLDGFARVVGRSKRKMVAGSECRLTVLNSVGLSSREE